MVFISSCGDSIASTLETSVKIYCNMNCAFERSISHVLSVITVVFNGRYEIAKTLESVIGQDYPNIQYIVVDGDSNDGTGDIIERFRDCIDVYISEPDRGVYDAMNKGLAHARGEFIIFMNCGDIFADASAVTSAMEFTKPGISQVLLGCWKRRISSAELISCRPFPDRGIFNHQAIIYSREIHAWHGLYVDVKGFTTADYLFFITLFDLPSVSCICIETTLAVIDINGISAGSQTFSQKMAIDFICGRASKVRLLLILLAHPIYRRIKTIFRRLI